MLPHLIHIVKRFGQVGGMENYVWHLVHGIAARGHSISVICEEVYGLIGSNIDIYKVTKAPEKPRWKSMLAFRARVDSCIREKFTGRSVIIHSHERSLYHQVTTFHGPPIDEGRMPNWIAGVIPRIRAWRLMESDEVLRPQVQWVLPVSGLIKTALIERYPSLAMRQMQLGWPGVDPSHYIESPSQTINNDRFLFVGKEWKRKGLARAVDIVAAYREHVPSATLDVFGPRAEEIPKLFRRIAWLRFNGWNDRIPWGEYCALIHPAEKEPFGMVVPEARVHGIPVLISEKVGASDLGLSCVKKVSLTQPLSTWVEMLNELLSMKRTTDVRWTWDDLVSMHCEIVYPHTKASIV